MEEDNVKFLQSYNFQ